MMLLKKLLLKFSKPKPFLLDNTYKIVPAFEWRGDVYYQHEDPLNTATGRGLSFMQATEELMMRCSQDYLLAHIKAVEEIIGNPKRIDLGALFKLHENLKERVNLLIAVPEHVYKLAAVVYFTKDESPYKYDRVAGARKIKDWQAAEGMYDFFLQKRLDTMLPFLSLPEEGSQRYLELQEKITDMHLQDLRKVLSQQITMDELKN
jgi:hypothetical protein